MSGTDSFMWRGSVKWSELITVADYVLAQWNGVTKFVSHTDKREHIWTARHESVSQPFLVFNEDSLHGSVPRMGNPLALLLLIGMVRARPGCVQVTFADGRKVDLARFDPADLLSLLPQATHAAHKKLASLVASLEPMPAPVTATK